MKKEEKKPWSPLLGKRFESFAIWVIGICAILFMGALTIISLMHTTGMEIVREGEGKISCMYVIHESLESVRYLNDNVIVNLIILGLSGLLCFMIVPFLKKVPIWVDIILLSAWTVTLGIIWVRSSQTAPSADSGMVMAAAETASRGVYDWLSDGSYYDKYFTEYSFQLGYVFFTEMMIRVVRHFFAFENILFLQYFNVIFLALTYAAIILINGRLFRDRRICHMTAIILALSIQPIIFSVFMYGIIPGLMFAVYAVYFTILYIQKNKIVYGFLAAVSIAIAVMIKSNFLIVLTAICIIIFVTMLKRKKFIADVIVVAVMIFASVNITPMAIKSYEKRGNYEAGDSIPFISWFAMGLNETSPAPGWYNYSYTGSNFQQCNGDPKLAAEKSRQMIADRVKFFIKNPQYTNDFFYMKFVSQWNETSYQSIWNNVVRQQYEPKHKFAEYVCTKAEKPVKKYMDFYAQLIFTAVLFGIIVCLKKKYFLGLTFPLILVGGAAYHILAEAKSQYSLPYFIIMTGFAACGIIAAYDAAAKRSVGHKRLSRLFPIMEPAVLEYDKPKAEKSGSSAQTDVPAEEKADKADIKTPQVSDEGQSNK